MSEPEAPPRGACPICGKPRLARYEPFCSKRCADVDLNRWLGGRYAIPAEIAEESEPREETLPPSTRRH